MFAGAADVGVTQVAVLFARADSVYKTMPGSDVWDIERDARCADVARWRAGGGAPVVAHPPCRAWGKLFYFAKPRGGEKDLALFAVDQVRRNSGVLEHPKDSNYGLRQACQRLAKLTLGVAGPCRLASTGGATAWRR